MVTPMSFNKSPRTAYNKVHEENAIGRHSCYARCMSSEAGFGIIVLFIRIHLVILAQAGA